MPDPPPPSPASPAQQIPASVVLPRQPYPSPSDPRFVTRYSTTRRPPTPPPSDTSSLNATRDSSSYLLNKPGIPDRQQQQASLPLSPLSADQPVPTLLNGPHETKQRTLRNALVTVPEQHANGHQGSQHGSSPSSSGGGASKKGVHFSDHPTTASHAVDMQRRASSGSNTSSTRSGGLRRPANNITSASGGRQRSPISPTSDDAGEPIPGAAARRSKKFFISSPTTDSDDEQHLSFGGRNRARAGVAGVAQRHAPVSSSPLKSPAFVPKSNAAGVSAQTANGTAANVAVEEEGEEGEEDEDEDEEDEDDSDWSSETSDSASTDDEEERQAALRAEEQRQRDMFAKRVPSQVALSSNGSSLLSQLLHPETYSRNFASLPAHLRNNKSAVELARTGISADQVSGLERSQQGTGNNLTVTGLYASKSTAAMANAVAPDRRTLLSQNGLRGPGLRPTASANHLTRLGGAPSGVELESDDDDSDSDSRSDRAGGGSEAASVTAMVTSGDRTGADSANGVSKHKKLTTEQHERLASLMQRHNSKTQLAPTAAADSYVDASYLPRQDRSAAAADGSSAAVPALRRVLSSTTNMAAMQAPQPVQSQGPAAYTPRTTRRTMLATELTQSLRLNLVLERQTRSRLSNMVAAVSSRLAGRAAQGGDDADNAIHSRSDVPEFAPSSSSDHEPTPPTVMRGNTAFRTSRVERAAQMSRSSQRAMHVGRDQHPPSNGRANSDSAIESNYYSPGFHST